MDNMTLPKIPFAGMEFTPYGTDSVGTVHEVISADANGNATVNVKGQYTGKVRYSYKHNPQRMFLEPYSDIRKFAHNKKESK